MRRLALLAALALGLGALAQSAGAWFAGTFALTATTTATALLPGSTPTAQVHGRAITVSWAATAFADGSPAPGYALVRYSAAAPTVPIAPSGGCAGLLATTACVETAVPAGTWRYAVVPRAGTAWRGAEGSASAPATVAPAALLPTPSLVGGPLPRTVAVAVSGFDPQEQVTFRLDDAAAGVALLASSATADAEGTATAAVTIGAAADGAHVLYGIGGDGTQASAPLRVDTTPPTTTDSTGSLGSAWSAQPRTVALTASDGATGSGVAATYWTADGSTPVVTSPQGSSATLAADGVYTLRYFSIDVAGNAEAVRTAGTQIRIDRTAPTPGALTTAGATQVGGSTAIRNGQALTASATDPIVNGASSGVAAVAYYACPGDCTPTPGQAGTLLIGSSATAPSYSVAWSGQPADGRYSLIARATDGAGSTADSAIASRVIDNTGPTVSGALADAQANQAGFINRRDTFYAYANAVDAGVGIDPATVTADLSAQCGSGCAAVPLSSAGGPFTVLTSTGSTTYAYRSALQTTSPGASGAFTVRAADALGAVGSASGTAVIDTANSIPAPASVTLATGYAATGFATCPVTANGYINAARASAETVAVVTASSAPAGGVVVLTATSGSTTLTFSQAVAQAGTRTVTFDGLALQSLGDGVVTLTATERTPGGNAVSTARTQAVTKLTSTPAVVTGALVYADNASPAADRVSSTAAAGPPNGYLSFTQTAGTRVGTTYLSAALSATGVLGALDLAAESTRPTYAVAAVDAACNPSATATWSPTATR